MVLHRFKSIYALLGAVGLTIAGIGLIVAVVNATRPRPLPAVKTAPTDKSKLPIDLSSPENTIQSYIQGLMLGDRVGALQCYNRKDFVLSQPIPIKSFQIVKRTVFTSDQAAEWNARGTDPLVNAGDAVLYVKQVYLAGPDPYQDEQTGVFIYYLRPGTDGRWTIFTHQPGPQS